VRFVAIRSKNLNLIPILQALLKQVSVAKAASQIGMSQPAMSGALARLRDLLNDPLLVRMGRRMQLTPRALQMRKQLDEMCAQIDAFFQPEQFDPATATQSFVIAAPDYIALRLSGTLLERLSSEAPGVRLKFVDVPIDLPKWLEESVIDLAVCGNFGNWPGLRREHLMWNRMVIAVSRDHPLTRRTRVTSNDLREYPSLDFDATFPSANKETRFVTGIPSLDVRSQVCTSQFSDAVFLAVRPPIIARAPALLVEQLAEILPLVVIELSGEETKIDESMFWAPICDVAQEQVWLRTLVRDCFAPYADNERVRAN
jgi:DNA-binding transcriptional LysR family regulator